MTSFISEDFLLHTDFARTLYHQYAKDLPIIDYHCHLSPKDIYDNRRFENITRIWLEGDHYKWRAMRALGIDERFITGNASDGEKFEKWARAVPYTLRNPLFHWTHLELKRYFGVADLLKPETAKAIYDHCSALLQRDDYATRALLTKMKVETVCTTDDPADSLDFHQRLVNDNFSIPVLPAFRPDKAYAVDVAGAYNAYLEKLSHASGSPINSFDALMAALEHRINFFHDHGCRLADHGIENLTFPGEKSTFTPDALFDKIRKGGTLHSEEREHFRFEVLIRLCRLYHKKGWAQQFHLGALRNTNERMLRTLGPDTGFDSIGDFSQSVTLSRFLNELDKTDQLARTIVYNLNPADNEVMATMIGNFNGGTVKGKMQFGSAWWFLDQKDGMEKHLNTLSNMGLLSCFIGMLTDSRSFLSYPRHEYFRRILCNLFGNDVKNGELPWDEQWLGKIISDICYHNAKSYFDFKRGPGTGA